MAVFISPSPSLPPFLLQSHSLWLWGWRALGVTEIEAPLSPSLSLSVFLSFFLLLLFFFLSPSFLPSLPFSGLGVDVVKGGGLAKAHVRQKQWEKVSLRENTGSQDVWTPTGLYLGKSVSQREESAVCGCGPPGTQEPSDLPHTDRTRWTEHTHTHT